MSNPIPHGSALARLVSGEPIDRLQTKRDELRALMVEYERALDEAEQREARITARRQRAGEDAARRAGVTR